MRYLVILALLCVCTAASAQNGKWNVTPPQPYTRADFVRDCVRMAPDLQPQRREWIARCEATEVR